MVLTRRAAERAEDPHTGVPSLRVPASPRETFIPQTLADDNDLQIADNNGSRYLWDPSEPIATRPLVWLHGGSAYSYTHDGNKNVSELVDGNGAVTAHYEYAPFGDVTVAAGNLSSDNPFRFSSEYADDALGLVYYNYRHYDPVTGRWGRRDPSLRFYDSNLYEIEHNNLSKGFDFLGKTVVSPKYNTYDNLLISDPNLIKNKEEFFNEKGLGEGGETKVDIGVPNFERLDCQDGKQGAKNFHWAERTLEVSYYIPPTHPNYNDTVLHEEHHVASAQKLFFEIDNSAVMPSLCLCDKCFNTLINYYVALANYMRKIYDYREHQFDYSEYGKRLYPDMGSSMTLQYSILVKDYLELNAFWGRTYRACEIDNVIPAISSPPEWPRL